MLRKLLGGSFYARMLAYDILRWHFVNNNRLYKHFLQKRIVNKTQKFYNRPYMIDIEITNHCNANCIFCPRDTMTRKRGFMDSQLFQKIIDEAVEMGLSRFNLTGFGEAFLDKNLSDRIRYIKTYPHTHVSLFTNGSLLTAEINQQIVEMGLDELTFSIDSAIPEEFNHLRQNLDFNTVLDNMKGLKAERDRIQSSYPLILVSAVASNRSDLPRIKVIYKFFSPLVDLIFFSYQHNWGDFKLGEEKSILPCYFPWEHMMVRWDGRVSLCCIDYNCEHVLGYLRKQTIQEVWENGASIRRLHLEGKREEIELCRNCTFFPNWWINKPWINEPKAEVSSRLRQSLGERYSERIA